MFCRNSSEPRYSRTAYLAKILCALMAKPAQSTTSHIAIPRYKRLARWQLIQLFRLDDLTQQWIDSVSPSYYALEQFMTREAKTAIVTGASQGIGAGVTTLFLARGYNVVATSRRITNSDHFGPSDQLALVDGDIAHPTTAKKIVEVAMDKFGSIEALVNNAGIFLAKPFVEFTLDDYKSLAATNIEGFLHLTQLVVKQMLAQKTGGSIVSITTAIVDHPIAGLNASVAMITKGGLAAISRSLAMEYAKCGIRVNTVAPGIVDTPLHKNNPKEFLKTLSPMSKIAAVKDIAEAVLYLTEASQVTGEVLHVDGGAHLGRW